MLFNSVPFIFVFLPIAVVGYYLLGRMTTKLAAAWLAIVSFVFYGWTEAEPVLILCGSITFNYVLGSAILSARRDSRLQRLLLVVGIAGNIGLLFYFKYLFSALGFFHQQGLLGQSFGTIALPLGISFFTFTQLGYLIDCKAGMVKENSFVSYAVFVTFFPHLIAGPFLHHAEIMPQFAKPETFRFKFENLSIGLMIFVLGLGKKVLIADSIAPWAEAGFDRPDTLQFFGAWSVALIFSLQLYYDFSAYSDMAIGLAKMFGVRFPLNFNSPFKAASIIEFWERWHMTLSRFVNYYVYTPMVLSLTRRRARLGKPIGKQATATLSGFFELVVAPSMITMALVGIWHGAGLQFVILGLVYGVYISINHAWRIFGPRANPDESRLLATTRRAAKVLLTYLCVVVVTIFFRANSTADAITMLGGIAGRRGFETFELTTVWANEAVLQRGTTLAVLLAITWFAPNVHQIMGAYSPALAKASPTRWRVYEWQPTFSRALVGATVFVACVFMLQRTTKFLYFQF